MKDMLFALLGRAGLLRFCPCFVKFFNRVSGDIFSECMVKAVFQAFVLAVRRGSLSAPAGIHSRTFYP